MRKQIIDLAFAGDASRFDEFVGVLRSIAPPGTEIILRGSAVTGVRWEDGKPFDADGPGTSDLDITFIGREMLELWEAFYIPRLHTVPHSDEHPEACPPLDAVRDRLCALAGRPVNLQASSGLVQFARDVLFDQPYYTLIDKSDDTSRETPSS